MTIQKEQFNGHGPRRGGNFLLIPMDVRDTAHESYDAWAAFLYSLGSINYTAEETRDAWENFLVGWNASAARYL